MGNKILTIVLVSIIAVLIGVGVVVKQNQDSSLGQILEKQDKLLSLQQTEGMKELVEAQKALEAKIGKLEADIKAIKDNPQAAARPQPPTEDYDKVHEIPVEHSYLAGKENAPVIIVEFVDFQCPFCARFHQPIVEVLKAYPNEVKYMIKNFPLPFHPQARPAAKAALAAGEQGKYYEMADKILENSAGLNDPAIYERLAKEIDLNVGKFKKDLESKDAAYEDIINKDMTLGESVDVRGTPTFYLNGKKTMARDLARFKAEIDAILQK